VTVADALNGVGRQCSQEIYGAVVVRVPHQAPRLTGLGPGCV
jgi:hypothetical protein